MEIKRIVLNEEDENFIGIKEEWFAEATRISTPEQLKSFADHLFNDYEHDYGTVVRAVSALALAGAWTGANIEGITGFQAGFVLWDFIKYWEFKNNKCGLKLVDYDNMLYPQYEKSFEKAISKRIWEHIQEEAHKKLKGCENCADEAVEHWKSIVNGKVPFGYVVRED